MRAVGCVEAPVTAGVTMSTVTTGLQLPEEYREPRTRVFPSPESLRWFMRGNHSELIRRQALVMPAGRKLVNPTAFDQVVVEVGARKAAGRARARITGAGYIDPGSGQ